MSIAARVVCVEILAQVFEERGHIQTLLDKNHPEKNLLQAWTYGVLRWQRRLAFLSEQLLEKPLKDKDLDLKLLLDLALFQLLYQNMPASMVVHGSVEACAVLGKPWAKGLVNACLRRFLREQPQLLAKLKGQSLGVRYSYPDWWVEHLQQAYPADWPMLLAEGNAQPPLFLRVNHQKMSTADYQKLLTERGMVSFTSPLANTALHLPKAVSVEQLPGFAEGLVSVQDLAAQLAAPLLNPQPGENILDACAAPGGKSGHLAERLGEHAIKLIACDSDRQRLSALHATQQRLQLPFSVRQQDLSAENLPWPKGFFQKILLDAPCSGSGVIRRHPDGKWLKRKEDLKKLTETQQRLLKNLWPLLADGGVLLYVTCSVFPEENTGVLATFCREEPRAQPLALPWTIGSVQAYGQQLLPGTQRMDGFFYAALYKPAS
jgi:16S rRNA (cytosine967-C5)-methyltransferase